MPTVSTLVLVKEGNQVLLGYKKRGFGAGKWNGFGGKVEQGETIKEAALRELKEESGLGVEKLDLRGVLDFSFNDSSKELKVYVFLGSGIKGNLIETEEMRPDWFASDNIPYDKMWVDDVYWIPLLFEGSYFTGRFVFKDKDKLASHSTQRVARATRLWQV